MQVMLGIASPVVEISGDDQRFISRNMGIDAFHQFCQLIFPLAFEQAQVDADYMYFLLDFRYPDGAMQKTAAGRSHVGDIDVFPSDERVFAEDGIAVVAGFIDGVLAIGVMLPDLVGEKFELTVIRPVVKPVVGDGTFAVYLLQKEHVGINITQRFLYIMQDKAAITDAESFMDVVCQDI